MACAVILPLKQVTDWTLTTIQSLLQKKFYLVLLLQNTNQIDRRLVNIAEQNKRCMLYFNENQESYFSAMKNVMKQLQDHHPEINGVVTLSHHFGLKDIERAADTLSMHKHSIILGVRTGKRSNRLRSNLKSRLASILFNVIYGTRLTDIHSGLIAIPLHEFHEISDEGIAFWDFEVYALIKAKQLQAEVVEIPVYNWQQTKSMHHSFNESFRTYLTIFSGFIGYSFSTIVAAIVDLLLFTILSSYVFLHFPLQLRIFSANAIARVASSFCDFSISRKYVFGKKTNITKSMIKYYMLWLTLLSASSMFVYLSKRYLDTNLVIAKIAADLFLGIISYQVQLRWVFKNKEQ